MSKLKHHTGKCQGASTPPLNSTWSPPSREKIRAAVAALFSSGAHFVIVRADKKIPLWRGWKMRRPSPDSVMRALDAGYRIGIIPASVDMAVIDVDAGDPSLLHAAAPPRLLLPTGKPARAHLYYAAGDPPPTNTTQHELTLDGGRLTVDVIHSHPYVIIYGWNLPPVAAAAAGGTGGRFPGEFFDDSDTNRARAKYNRRRAALEDTLHAIDGRAAGTGRNNTIFWNAWSVAKHDYPAGRLPRAELIHYCYAINSRFADPLDDAEVDKIIGSIWKFLTERFPTPPSTPRPDARRLSRRGQAAAAAAFSRNQAWRATRRGRAAAAAAAPDVKRAIDAIDAGDTQAAVAAALGKHVKTVRRWTAPPDTLDPIPPQERARALHADGVDVAAIAAALDTPVRTIQRWVDSTAARAERNARIVAMHDAGDAAPKIAADLKISRRTVVRVLAAAAPR